MRRAVFRKQLTQDEEGQLGVFQVVHHHHVSGEVVPDREQQLGLGGRRTVHDAQVVLPQERQRGHGDALRLALGVLALVLVAVQTPDAGGSEGQEQPREPQQPRQQLHVNARHLSVAPFSSSLLCSALLASCLSLAAELSVRDPPAGSVGVRNKRLLFSSVISHTFCCRYISTVCLCFNAADPLSL